MPQQTDWFAQFTAREVADAGAAPQPGGFASPAASAPGADWFAQFATKPAADTARVPSSFAMVNGQPVADAPDDDPTWMDSATNFFSEALTALKPATWMKAADAINPLYVSPETGNWMPYETLRSILHSPGPLAKKAKDAFEKGEYAQGARHAINYLLPLVGPRLDQAGDLMAEGETARGLGATIDVAGQLMGPQAIGNLAGKVKLPPLVKNPNAVDAAAVQAGLEAGVPVDAATATGNPYVRGIQRLAEHTSYSGASVGQTAAKAQAAGLADWGAALANKVAPGPARTIEQAGENLQTSIAARAARDAAARTSAGTRLAGKVSPSAVSAEEAGQGVRDAISARISALRQEANAAYDGLRQIEAGRADAMPAPAAPTASPALAGQRAPRRYGTIADIDAERVAVEAMYRKDFPGFAQELSPAAYREMIDDELASRAGFLKPSQPGDPVTYGVDAGGSGQRSYELPPPPVRGNPSVATPAPDAGLGGAPRTRPTSSAPLSVDMAPVKSSLRPVYDRLLQTMPIAQRDASPGLLALKNILEGPDEVPLSVADAGLSSIKRIARGAESPDLANVSQGTAKLAVDKLDAAVQRAATKAGPEATRLLREGRAAVKAKYAAAEVLDALHTEPVKAAGQLTRPKDVALRQLQEVKAQAPAEIPKLARAYVDGLLEADPGTASRQWAQLGSQTKALLINNPTTRIALDTYFRPGPGPAGSAAEVLKTLPAEPVRILTQATYAKDAGIAKLQALDRLAPEQMPVVGRAFLDDMLTSATAKGGFDGAAGLKATWDKLGPKTKAVLFKDPAHVRELDHFFHLAARMNPALGSPTAYVLGIAAHAWNITDPVTFVGQELLGSQVARLMHSPAGVKALTRGMTAQVGNTASAATAYGNLTRTVATLGREPVLVPSHAQGAAPASAPGTAPGGRQP